jgi:hypothetical protein
VVVVVVAVGYALSWCGVTLAMRERHASLLFSTLFLQSLIRDTSHFLGQQEELVPQRI